VNRAFALLPFLLLACGDDGSSSNPPTCATACEAPAPTCKDDGTLTVYTAGTCVDGACQFASADIVCEAGCVVRENIAACAGDPCDGVTCDTPPSACHSATGLCSGGVCTYPIATTASCDDGDACTDNDTCDGSAQCAGTPRTCQTPPPSTCDGDMLIVHGANGTCNGGACTYTTTSVACPDGCEDGRCLGDPCANITCDTPPSPCHADTGTCRDGVCDYAFEDGAPCDDNDGCTENDQCQSGVCGGASKVCQTPPNATCESATTLTGYANNGTCTEGTCQYATTPVTCEFGCVENNNLGSCLGDPCANVTCNTPPANSCTTTAEGPALETWSATGICGSGTCTYTKNTSHCPHGCEAASTAAGTPARCRPPTGLVIAELRYDTQGFPDVDSFVEVHGPPNLSLAGVTLVGVNGNGGTDYGTLTLTGTLDASGLYVIAHPGANPALTAVSDQLDAKVDLQNGPDSLQLRYGDTILDAVAYGTFGNNDLARGEGAPHPGAPVDLSLARDHAYTDTNDNAADFTAGPATPGLPTPPPEVPPTVALLCPSTGQTGEALTFDATSSTGDIEQLVFDFGDGSTPLELNTLTATHTFANEGAFTVTATATSPGGQTDSATCNVMIEDAEEPVVYTAARQCFSANTSYLYHVISDPVPPTTDVKLTVTYSGISQYGVRPYTIQVQTGANTWVSVLNTLPSKQTEQTQHFVVDRQTIQQAITAMGWLRFRWSYLTNGASDNCLALTVTYNCERCFECPPGEEDLGIGCRSTTANYDYTALEHPRGECATSNETIILPGTPLATGDGTLTVQSLGCGSATARMRIQTNNSGSIDLGPGSAGNCSYSTATWTIPRAYLANAVSPDHTIAFTWSLTDTCASGTGCAFASDPCVKNVRLTFPR
jgi:hypothetical protein